MEASGLASADLVMPHLTCYAHSETVMAMSDELGYTSAMLDYRRALGWRNPITESAAVPRFVSGAVIVAVAQSVCLRRFGWMWALVGSAVSGDSRAGKT